MKRTHSCGELSEKHLGKTVLLQGWVGKKRHHGKLVFIDLRDRYGVTQVVFSPEKSKRFHKEAEKLGKEFVVEVRGEVAKRPEGTENKELSTGKIEVAAEGLEILSTALSPLPVEVDEYIKTNEEQRLKYRFIDLRRKELQENLALRHGFVKAARDFFDGKGFLEIETPILAKSTPEGARDYLVPSRVHEGKFFALPQSPQLFKQLLMVSGFDRYFQIARCFRDEDLRADRQPEFTQVDVEMSFVEEKDVQEMVEQMFAFVFSKVMKQKLRIPFPRMTYREAMDSFGSDAPDIRCGLELADVAKELSGTEFNVFNDVIKSGGSIKALNAKNCAGFSRKELDELGDAAKAHGAKGLVTLKITNKGIESNVSKFLKQQHILSLLKKTNAVEGDLLLVVADEWKKACTALGAIRKMLAAKLNLVDEKKQGFVWVVDFPLFEYSEEDQRLVAMHHPFTSPKDGDLKLLETSPEKVKARAYDIVWNGSEVGGGSIRINKPEVQERMFRALGISKEQAQKRFGFLLEAFKYGAPPHGGIALGLDRIIALLAKAESIRDVIAFPKNKACVSLMDGAPSDVSSEQLKDLHVKLDLLK